MKKFLSILLAVMMVLSTVSFAAPSIAGTADVAVDMPVAEVPAEEAGYEAELATVYTDKSALGTLIYKIDFEKENFDVDAFGTAYAMVEANGFASYINPDFGMANVSTYTNSAGTGLSNLEIVKDGDNSYLRGDAAAGYSGFFSMSKYGTDWPEGYYTFSVDVKMDNAASGSSIQFNDTKIPYTNIHAFVPTSTEWQTVTARTTNVVAGTQNNSGNNDGYYNWYGLFFTPSNAVAGKVSYDNWEVYYRPATVTLTIDGVGYEFSTDAAVSMADIAAKITVPTGYELKGVSLTEGGEVLTGAQYFFEDATLYPVFVKDTTIHDVYGKPLFIVDFENEAAQTWWGHSEYDNSTCSYGAQLWTVATKYDARFDKQNFRIRFITNEGTHGNQGVAVDGSGNHYNKGTTLVQWPNVSVSNWGNVMGEAGVYTYVFDRMISGASSVSPASPAGFDIVDDYDGVQGVWDKVVLQKTLTEAGKIPDGNIANFSLAAADKGVAEISYDNFILYYKPLQADVTLIVDGEEYVAEDVATTGVSAASILEKAGVSVPYGKKPVLSATFGGESVGNVINLVMDSTFFVSFVNDDSIHPVYGKRMFLIDFENLTAVTDLGKVSLHTDDYDASYANATINWEAGANTIVEEGGNKYLKGQQGWAQVRINNADYANLPAGTYTMSLKTKNFGSATEQKSIASKDQKGGENATFVDPFNDNGEWDTVAAQLPKATEDFTIYYTAPMTTDVAFDDIAIYYLPEKVNLTIVNGDEVTTKNNVTNGVTAEELLSDIEVPFGYKVALSTTGDVADVITGKLTLVSDATLYVVNVPDEKVDFNYGEALIIIDFERPDMQGWNGNAQEIDNSVDGNGAYVYKSASYYDERFVNQNYRVRFVIGETSGSDQKTVVDENGNHYTYGTNGTRWVQVAQTNYGNIEGEAGTYTYMFDVMTDVQASDFGKGASMTRRVDTVGNPTPGEWHTIIVQYDQMEDGVMLKPQGGTVAYFNAFEANGVAKVGMDNFKLFFKPFKADVTLMANGEVVKTVAGVDTTEGILVSDLVAGVKVKGYDVVGAKLGTTVYGLDETVVPPCDCTVELVLEVREQSAATPETSDEHSMRVADPVGMRFKASVAKDAAPVEFGWIVTRASLLEGAGIEAADFTKESSVKKVQGKNFSTAENIEKIFEQDDAEYIFTAVLYFANTEADGVPSVEKLTDYMIARPYALDADGEYVYGAPSEPISVFDVCMKVWNNEEGDAWNSLSGDEQDKIYAIMDKCDTDQDGVADIFQK